MSQTVSSALAERWGVLQDSRLLPRIVLPLIVAVHFASVLSLHPTSLFGLLRDDTLYFSAAKALAQGQGNILPSLPGTPAATTFPILYPWLLSSVWRLNPVFPANLPWAVAITYLFALAAICLTYFFCRLPLRLPRVQALGITAFCALHPSMIFYSARVMTDVPFAALTLAFLLLAWRATETDSAFSWAVFAGLCADLCVLLRLVGIALIAGAVLVMVLRKYWKTAAAFLTACVPAFAYFCYQSWWRVPSPPPVPFSTDLPGWKQTWFFYTSYTAFRHLDTPSLAAAKTVLLNQTLYLVSGIAGYFVAPLFEFNIAFWFACSLVFATLLVLGLVRQISQGKQVTIAVLVTYVVLLLGWNYVDWGRFLLPFFPLIVALVGAEAFRCVAFLRSAASDARTRALLTLTALCLGALVLAAGWNCSVVARAGLAEVRFRRESVLPDKLEAYAWMRDHTSPQDRFIATEDVLAYLHTGRQFINFTIPMPYDVYDADRLQRDLDHMPDVALAVRARYWVLTTNDSQTQLSAFEGPLRARLNQWREALPLVYRSSGGVVGVYDLACFQKPRFEGCPPAVMTLLAVRNGGRLGAVDAEQGFVRRGQSSSQ